MDQKVEYIDLDKLVLWTENPRDPIDKDAVDQDIVDRAMEDKSSKWTLTKLANEMGDYYDFSELPTVVYHKGKPIVYDGNRRIILGKIKHGLVSVENTDKTTIPEFPFRIPCNVCTEEIAINNVLRKHGESGTWSPLDRDIFLNKFKKQPKSLFLKLEENTGLISNNPGLNKGFVKKEIFNLHNLQEMGFSFEDDDLVSKHTSEESKQILENVTSQVLLKNITTRTNRGQILSLLDKENKDIIDKNKAKSFNSVSLNFTKKPTFKVLTQTRRTKPKAVEIFGQKLYLKPGDVNNLHRDIVDLHSFYIDKKQNLSSSFPSLIRMSLRLLCEAAAGDEKMDQYIKKYFQQAKKSLSVDDKTTLSAYSISETNLAQLLHIGAHKYSAANNFDKTIAISIILGAMINISHGK